MFTPKELKRIGERIYTLERMMLVQEGISRQEDTLPKRYFDEPISEGPAQGPSSRGKNSIKCWMNTILSRLGSNGIPVKKTLKRIGLDE